MKKFICVLITIMLAGCGSKASAAVQKSAESKIAASSTTSASPVATASAETTASASPTPEAEETVTPASTPSATPVTTPVSVKEQKSVDNKQEASTTVENAYVQQPSASSTVNPDEQGYWDANGCWVGYGWWNTDASGNAVYHYDGVYHEASTPASQAQTDYSQPVENTVEPVQNSASSGSFIDAVAAAYNGQYARMGCEAVATMYLTNGGTDQYHLTAYQVSDLQPNDIIAYYDSGWNYRHTAVYLGRDQALHGNYGSDKTARVASMYISGYPNMVYFRYGGDANYFDSIKNVAKSNGGSAGWLDAWNSALFN